jgi:hypothetical protein
MYCLRNINQVQGTPNTLQRHSSEQIAESSSLLGQRRSASPNSLPILEFGILPPQIHPRNSGYHNSHRGRCKIDQERYRIPWLGVVEVRCQDY